VKKPNDNDIAKCISYRCASKNGKFIGVKGTNFCQEIHRKYPKWYKQTEHEIFEITKPFGAR